MERQSPIVAFLFTDIEGSTRLWEADPRAMAAALARHDAILHGAIAAGMGEVFKTAGDAFCAVFPTPAAALTAAAAAQLALAAEPWQLAAPLRVRMAIHAGEAEARDGDYFGPPLNRVARLLATAHGEQILVSRAASELARDHLPAPFTLRDLGEHALKDLDHPERIAQVVAPGLRADFPPLRTPAHLLRLVPVPPTPLIGREREVAAARAIFGLAPSGSEAAPAERPVHWQEARLLTLTGPGGAGKTRLALHLASELGSEFADGAVFVSLAALTEPALVLVEMAGALDLGEQSGSSARELLIAHLRDRHLLLILDNFEQVMGAATMVSDLLSHCPRLRVLVTSRERLSVRGEQDLPLPPLALPEPFPKGVEAGETETPVLDAVRQSEAVRLFVERARMVLPAFEVTAENADAVVDICQRLDGLPLAIELAAARVRFLPPRALLDRFDRRLDVLDRGPRDLPARQQTMRDTIAWSYDLLDPAEQQLFTRLCVFAGGATFDACAAVCGEDDLDLLEPLAEKSLLHLPADGGEARMTMLQTIRDFGEERLASSGEHETIRQRHAAYFLALAEESEPLLAGREQKQWLDRLEREQANVRAAIGWLRQAGRLEEALRLAGALWRFWWLRGDMGEGRGQLETLLQVDGQGGAGVAPAVRAKALNGAGVLAECQGDWETAARFHEESLEISRRLGDLAGVAWSLNNLGVVAIDRGDFERAQSLLEENLAAAEEANDEASVATALIDLGQIAHLLGDYGRATALWTRSLALFRHFGNESQVARALTNLGTVAVEQGDYSRADALLTESLALHRGIGDRQGIAGTLNNLAKVRWSLGDPEAATNLYLESHVMALEGSNQLYAAIAMENLAALAHLSGDLSTAQIRFQEALRLYRAVSDQQGVATCLGSIASLAAAQGDFPRAAALLGAVSGLEHAHEEPAASTSSEIAASLRTAMGEPAFAAAWRSGQETPLDDILDGIAHEGRWEYFAH